MSAILALDTSNRRAGRVAVAVEGRVVSSRAHDREMGPAEGLLALIDEALGLAGLDLGRLDGLAVVTGPGSYTGLRIGVMTAKSLAYARGLPLLSAGVLTTLAGSCVDDGEPTPILCATEAGGGHVYVARLEAGDEPADLHGSTRRIPAGELRAEIVGARTVALDTGSLLEQAGLHEPAAAGGEPSKQRWALAPIVPLADRLAIAASGGRSWCHGSDPVALVPLYLGPSQAERAHGVDLGDEVHRLRPPTPGGER